MHQQERDLLGVGWSTQCVWHDNITQKWHHCIDNIAQNALVWGQNSVINKLAHHYTMAIIWLYHFCIMSLDCKWRKDPPTLTSCLASWGDQKKLGISIPNWELTSLSQFHKRNLFSSKFRTALKLIRPDTFEGMIPYLQPAFFLYVMPQTFRKCITAKYAAI